MNFIFTSRTEESCELQFQSTAPWWHLYTPGISTPLILCSGDDKGFAVNLLARGAFELQQLKVATFEVMDNHIHAVISGREEDCLRYFVSFRKRLGRFLGPTQTLPDCFRPQLKPVPDLKALRNTIVYVNRNGYVANPTLTPFSDPYGGGRFYFNDINLTVRLSELKYRDKRTLLHGRAHAFPADPYIVDGIIAPPSWCKLELGMSMFRNARHYFRLLTKNVEAYRDIAEFLDDDAFLTDGELFDAARRISANEYGETNPRILSDSRKLELARRMHYDYRASNGQIRRVLGMTKAQVDSIFPMSAVK